MMDELPRGVEIKRHYYTGNYRVRRTKGGVTTTGIAGCLKQALVVAEEICEIKED